MTEKRLLLVIDTLEIGGSETSIVALARSLNTYQPSVAALYGQGPLVGELERARIPFFDLNVDGARYGFGSRVFALGELVDRVRPQIVMSSLFRSDMVARLCKGERGWQPGIGLFSSLVSDGYAGVVAGRKRVIQAADAATAGLVDRFVANSYAIRESNSSALSVPQSRIEVIARGRDLEVFRPAIAAGYRTHLVVTMVGRLIASKGHRLLLSAWAEFAKQGGPRAVLRIVGDGPERVRLMAEVMALGLSSSVEFLGARDDVAEILRESDVFVFPSRLEGFPGAVVEAMASGLPCIVSDIGVHREMGRHQQSLWFFEDGSSQALLRALQSVLDDAEVRARLGREARCVAVERYSLAAMARAFEDSFDSFLAERH